MPPRKIASYKHSRGVSPKNIGRFEFTEVILLKKNVTKGEFLMFEVKRNNTENTFIENIFWKTFRAS